jgi:hypothetical protein
MGAPPDWAIELTPIPHSPDAGDVGEARDEREQDQADVDDEMNTAAKTSNQGEAHRRHTSRKTASVSGEACKLASMPAATHG